MQMGQCKSKSYHIYVYIDFTNGMTLWYMVCHTFPCGYFVSVSRLINTAQGPLVAMYSELVQ